MAKSGITNVSVNNTFQTWLDKTNEVVDIIKTETLTASASGDTTGTVGSPFISTLIGTFSANTINATTSLRVDNISPLSGSTIVAINSPVDINTSQRISVDVQSTTNPVVRIGNPSVSWDVGFASAGNNFSINNGATTPRLSLTTTGELSIPSKIGIGVSPLYELDISGTDTSNFRIRSLGTTNTSDTFVRNSLAGNTGRNWIYFGDSNNDSSGSIGYFHDDDSMRFSTPFGEVFRLTSSGNVGIGVANPNTKLHVNGSVTATSFVGSFEGTVTGSVDTAASLTNPRSFSISGAVATTSAVSFNGTNNVQLDVVQQTNSVELGNHTIGDYVQAIAGGTGVTVSGGTGEGSTAVITNSDPGSSQFIFKNVVVSGQNPIVADSNNDTLFLVGTDGISITTNATTDTLTITNTRPAPPTQSAAVWNAGTSTVESLISPQKLRQANKIFAEAYVSYNGGTVPTLVSQYGINSVSRPGAGDTRFTFTTPQPNTNYVIESHFQFVGNVTDARWHYWIVSKSTTEFTVRWRSVVLLAADVDISIVCKRLS